MKMKGAFGSKRALLATQDTENAAAVSKQGRKYKQLRARHTVSRCRSKSDGARAINQNERKGDHAGTAVALVGIRKCRIDIRC